MILRTCSFESCDSLVEGNTEYCASHGHMLRKQAKQAKQVKVVTQPRKVSAKMAKDLQDYSVQRRQYLAGYRYWYEHKLAKDRQDICLGTLDPEKYCNGLYLYSTKDPGDGMAFVVLRTNDPYYPHLNS